MVNVRRRRNVTYSGGVFNQAALVSPDVVTAPKPRPDIKYVEPEEEATEMVDAPDQFIDTEGVRFIPMQSANRAIRLQLGER
jgi:hypothetical protein